MYLVFFSPVFFIASSLTSSMSGLRAFTSSSVVVTGKFFINSVFLGFAVNNTTKLMSGNYWRMQLLNQFHVQFTMCEKLCLHLNLSSTSTSISSAIILGQKYMLATLHAVPRWVNVHSIKVRKKQHSIKNRKRWDRQTPNRYITFIARPA